MTRWIRPLMMATLAASALLLARPALAGPPLLCFPFAIGDARSLPMGTGSWRAIDSNYDVSRLVDDTLAILSPDAPVTLRMETIRRATLYAATSPKAANALLAALQERAQHPQPVVARLAVFDFGYLIETFREASFMFSAPVPAIDAIDGYQLVRKAQALQADATIEQAARLIVDGRPKRTATKY
jgi:hypothetical protein